jgi:serine/threonine protein kinase/WD40 repeat protein
MTGQRVGHYQILEKIGAGGMGEVYRARDERLQRDVAVKLIRPASSGNADHIRRFEQEARAAAALNHPNIVAIYDVGFDQGLHFIVSELLEGQTLRQRLDKELLPLRQTTDYALQIVQGLIAAHERRIVHRDLKPENLFITREGRVKILDFGVAKLQPQPGEGPGTDTVQHMTTVTKSGAVIGTVAYMSPEQLRGKAVDNRSDIFSVGAILYEMLTGHHAFSGETEVDTMTAVLREEPKEIDLETTNIPPAFQEITRHCLEKEPENRFQSTRDLAFALETISLPDSKTVRYARNRTQTKRILLWVAAGVLIAAGLLLLGTRLRFKPTPITYRQLTFEQGTVYSARFARDGQEIIYGAAWNGKPTQLFSTVGNSLLPQALQITGADLLAVSPTNELAIATHVIHRAQLDVENGTLAEVPMAAASPREILQDVSAADWDTKGQLAVVHVVVGQNRLEFPVGHVLYQTNGRISHICISPLGDQIAFMNHPDAWDDGGTVSVVDLAGNVRALTSEWESEDGLAWSPNGEEVWFAAAEKGVNRSLRAVDLSGHTRTLLDAPGSLTLQDVVSDGRAIVTVTSIRLGMDAASLEGSDEVDLSWHDWNISRDISPDGQSVLFEDSSEVAGPNYAVVMRNLNGDDLPVRLGDGRSGGLSRDGKWAISILQGPPPKVVLLPLQAGQPRQIVIGALQSVWSTSPRFLPDGKHIVVSGSESGHGVRCYVLDLDEGKLRPVTPEGVFGGEVSPDGRYVMGTAGDKSFALYPIEGEGAPVRIPHVGRDLAPVQWSEDGSQLFVYRNEIPAKVYRVKIATGEESLIKELKPLSPAGVFRIAPVVVSRDGKHFLYSYNQALSSLWLISGLR